MTIEREARDRATTRQRRRRSQCVDMKIDDVKYSRHFNRQKNQLLFFSVYTRWSHDKTCNNSERKLVKGE